MAAPHAAHIDIAADDHYELFVNGAKVSVRDAAVRHERLDISRWIVPGKNVVAVRVTNQVDSYAGLSAQLTVQQSARATTIRTDHNWRCSVSPLPLWQVAQFNDFRWQRAQVLPDDAVVATRGPKAPDAVQQIVATPVVVPPKTLGSFTPVPEGAIERPSDFTVEQIDCHSQTGSVIAMTFNEFGEMVVSQEQGPLLVIHDSNGDGQVDTVRNYCDKLTNCQGLLCLNGDVYAVGTGEPGAGLYRLQDTNGDGIAETVSLVVGFQQEKLEHGAHGLVLGSDGMLYVLLGNHCRVTNGYAENSPHRNYYEGDLIQPRYEDPSGHALGIRAPGGVIIRTDPKGNKVELFAGGLRNPYDLAFNAAGELFTHDADMESDIGSTWYRPTRVNHVIPGAELGWRSGWAKWPDYYYDSLPPICDTGRGSPAGMVFYEHHQFPVEYHDTLFSCDWSEGRVWAITMRPVGATYEANSRVFLKGKPLNVTDIEVGPDGSLYMFTGGRGTKTLLYRVRYTGTGSQAQPTASSPLMSVVWEPQPTSAWSRQRMAVAKMQLGTGWESQIESLARDKEASVSDRVAAVRTMSWFGPEPSAPLLIELASDQHAELRAAACLYLGLFEPDAEITTRLQELVLDSDPTVRRRACEALVRGKHAIRATTLLRSLSASDRFEAWSARRLVEQLPKDDWYPLTLKTTAPREFVQLGLARLIVEPSHEAAIEIVARVMELLNNYVNDRDFLDMLRLVEVALIRGSITAADMPRLGEAIAAEFPAENLQMNRELLRLLCYLQEDSIKERYLQYLDSNLSPADRLHVVAHLRLLGDAWSTDEKVKLLRAIHRTDDEEQSMPPYIQNIGRDLAGILSPDERSVILSGGTLYPETALAVLYELPTELSPEQVEELQILDRRLVGVSGPSTDRLRAGIVAVLARAGNDQATAYLRTMYDRDADRRATIAIGLAQEPSGANWPYLVRSLPLLDEHTCREVLQQLAGVPRSPELKDASAAEDYHRVVDVTARFSGETASAAVSLLEKWQGIPPRGDGVTLAQATTRWRQWYGTQFPKGPRLTKVASHAGGISHTMESILGYLQAHPVTADTAQHGAAVFEKAQCSNCHRFAGRGESMGPDLSNVAQRFTQREILEAVLEPSRVISDQYASKTLIEVTGRSHSGILGSGGRRDYVVLKSDGTKVRVAREDVEEIVPSNISAMPTGLLDPLSLQEVHELISYLNNPQTRVATRGNGTGKGKQR